MVMILRDCKAIELMIDNETHPDDMMPGAYHHNQGISNALDRLRRAWEERHGKINPFEEIAFQGLASAHPHEMHEYDPDRF